MLIVTIFTKSIFVKLILKFQILIGYICNFQLKLEGFNYIDNCFCCVCLKFFVSHLNLYWSSCCLTLKLSFLWNLTKFLVFLNYLPIVIFWEFYVLIMNAIIFFFYNKLCLKIKLRNRQNWNWFFFIFRFKWIISRLYNEWINKCQFYGCWLNVFVTVFNNLNRYISVSWFQCFQNKIISLILNLVFFMLMSMSSNLRWIIPRNSS